MKFEIYKYDKLLATVYNGTDALDIIKAANLVIYTTYMKDMTTRIFEVVDMLEDRYKVCGLIPTITKDFTGKYRIQYDLGDRHICFTVDALNDIECQTRIRNRVGEWISDN